MKNFFIDLENVGSAGIHGAKDLDQDCNIHIFYSNNANKISLEATSELTKGKANVIYRKLSSIGKNALDFELVTIMSALIGETREGDYFIISGDTGYTAAIRCLLNEYPECNLRIEQSSSIANAINSRSVLLKKVMRSFNKEQSFDSYLQSIFSGSLYEAHIPLVSSLIKTTENKQDLYTSLIRNLGPSNGTNIYNMIKSNFFNLRDSLKLLSPERI